MNAAVPAEGAPHRALTLPLRSGRYERDELEVTGRLLSASNATFLTRLRADGLDVECVYKPTQGERPLWDFPVDTLGRREVAAYEVSHAAGFDCVPVTVFVEGPLGPGSLQAWVDSEEDAVSRLVDLVPSRKVPKTGWFRCVEGLDADDSAVSVIHADDPALRRLAVFDVLVNNADRKGGHILSSEGHLFGIDHGVTFNVDPKLRTLLWGWAGTELTETERELVRRARDEAPAVLVGLLDDEEVDVFTRRAERLLDRGHLPRPPRGQWPSIPWPPF
ncbi:SCO1664 family protein [Microlunatus flavus]|uniref:SCO1664 family protein n=1 Tax=Microlunatus flavus TaxID=1036181 RepID=A0A1H9DUW7_9ACTN|nr:SCO1664 family protein [Microlunatus flavus]SEQ17205.1 conserved hypothetical protein [Microlunatus flavus]